MVTRRTVISIGGGMAALGLAGYGGSLVWCGGRSLAALPLERLDVVLADIPAAPRIGRAFREKEGEAGLETAFRQRPSLLEAMAFDCPDTRRTALRATFRTGFETGDVIVADRWVVSCAEALVAALRAA